MAQAPRRYDVVIAGGGLVGLSAGVALGAVGLRSLVVDSLPLEELLDDNFDGRASAIAAGSRRALESMGVWQKVESASPINDIRISDGRPGEPASSLFLHFDSDDLGEGPLGHIVENRYLRWALAQRARELPAVEVRAPLSVESSERSEAGASVRLSDGTQVVTSLLIAADGRRSRLRDEAGIKTAGWSYGQTGIVATLIHERPHEDVAHEHFLPAGPFAVLPLADDEKGRHRSSLVWSEKSELAKHYVGLSDEDFSGEIMARFGDSLGEIKVCGKRWHFPLALLKAARYTDCRLALLGDAAHGMHPIAGQGFNLGLRGVSALAESIVDSRRLGLDPGSPQVLARYERWRSFDSVSLLGVTDALVRLFSNDVGPVRLARDLGLAAVQQIPPAKGFFMRHAMGTVGDLPRMMRGEAL